MTTTTNNVSNNPNVGIALALTCGAGAATALGAAVVFVPSLVKLASKRVLAGGLGLSAGVMTYVSFVEIFKKSYVAFENAGHEEGKAYALATICFFCGVVFMVVLNTIVTLLLKGLGSHHHHDFPAETKTKKRTTTISRDEQDDDEPPLHATSDDRSEQQQLATELAAAACPCCSTDPAGDLERLQKMADEMDTFQHQEHHDWNPAEAHGHEEHESVACCEQRACLPECAAATEEQADIAAAAAQAAESGQVVNDDEHSSEADHSDVQHVHVHNDEALLKMSINTALAIALHNFPEGLATFVAALSNPKVGVVLAVAIAIHNIPEGLCVALPIYYATGRKWKAFTWACLSGISEPIAALLGWAVLANSFTETMYGVLFGLVGGMMVIIAARELLPTAHRYDPEDAVVTFSFMAGMFIMALSLTLFVI